MVAGGRRAGHHAQSLPTLEGVRSALGTRGLVLSRWEELPVSSPRSTFPGSGRWVAHWLGDNWSLWSNLHYSIIGMLQFSQFGIPLVGADICGFSGLTNPEMCIRWHQLGAFYPFSRNHNAAGMLAQDPASLGGEAAAAIREVLLLRYYLLPHLYTLFALQTLTGGTVARPVWHEFPREVPALGLDTQFLLGGSLLVCPVLAEGQDTRACYLPKALWYEGFGLRTGPGEWLEGTGAEVTLHLPLNTTGVFLRGGAILPTQRTATNTARARLLPIHLHVFLDDQEEAQGHLYLDDGASIGDPCPFNKYMPDPILNEAYTMAEMSFEELRLTYSLAVHHFTSGVEVEEVWVVGLRREVTAVMVNEEEWGAWEVEEVGGRFYLHVTQLHTSVDGMFTIQLK